MPTVYEVCLINDMGHLTFASTPDLLADPTLESKILHSGLFDQIRGAITMYTRRHVADIDKSYYFMSTHYALTKGHPEIKEYDVKIDGKDVVAVATDGHRLAYANATLDTEFT